MQITPQDAKEQRLLLQAHQLEATFLSQMLACAGLDRAAASMGGGDGAAQFASFLRDAQADAMVEAGGLGLTESFFRALTAPVKGSGDAA